MRKLSSCCSYVADGSGNDLLQQDDYRCFSIRARCAMRSKKSSDSCTFILKRCTEPTSRPSSFANRRPSEHSCEDQQNNTGEPAMPKHSRRIRILDLLWPCSLGRGGIFLLCEPPVGPCTDGPTGDCLIFTIADSYSQSPSGFPERI
jgi:hypothetical protein